MTQDWENVVVDQEMTLAKVIRVIDKAALRFAMVVDFEQRLMGTITDGDVRRALIAEKGMDALAKDIMNANPTVFHPDISDAEVSAIMKEKGLLVIPITDSENRILGLRQLEDLAFGKKVENPVFVMAGGFGTRLHPITENCPKPMLKVGGRPVLENILLRFLKAGFRDFYFSTHFLPEIIRDHFGDGERFGCRIQYVHEDEPLGTGGALGLLPDDLPDLPLIMMNGDILTKVDFGELLKHHNQQESLCTMCVRQHNHQVPYGVIETSNNTILRILEKPQYTYSINAGIYAVSPELIRHVKKGERVDMTDLLDRQIQAGGKVSTFPIHEYWLDIGNNEDFQIAQRDAKDIF